MLNISDFPWAECSINDNRVMQTSDSISLRRTKRDLGILRYEFELVTTDMDMAQGRGIKAKLSAAANDTLLFKHPRLSFSQGTVPASAITVIGTAAKGASYLDATNVNNWQLMAGDYLQLSNNSKVYEIAEDTSTGSGQKTIKLTSQLVADAPADTNLIVNDVVWYLSSNGIVEVGMNALDNQDMQITLVAVERL